LLSVPQGQKKLVRWHDGTMTFAWIPERLLAANDRATWIVATTRWNDPARGPWLTERVLRIETLLDAMTASVLKECEQYWRHSRELFELDVRNFLMDNQGGR
jgi:ribonucleotide reductase beta subunit family protein with ferritin-like domain